MLDRHAVRELLRAGVTPRAVAKQFGVSRRTIERIAREPATAVLADARTRGVGRPRVDETVHTTVRTMLEAEPEVPLEVWRRLKEAGTPLGLPTLYRVVGAVRQTIPAEVLVRFEGVAGEFAQFDFGHVEVKLTAGARRRIHFAVYRLKYSRWMHVVVVPTERVEPLVRIEASGGVPLRVVFDNPRTVVLGRHEGRPVWNPTLAAVAIDYGFTIELCTPHHLQQKGTVENLVGFVKRAFFRAPLRRSRHGPAAPAHRVAHRGE